MTESSKLSTPPRVLVVEAHPDDAEWYYGGTIVKLAQAGYGTHAVGNARCRERSPQRSPRVTE